MVCALAVVLAEAAAGRRLERVVLGRPVYFIDDDPARDAQAQAALESAARQVGFAETRLLATVPSRFLQEIYAAVSA